MWRVFPLRNNNMIRAIPLILTWAVLAVVFLALMVIL